jgi:hypothetical protein
MRSQRRSAEPTTLLIYAYFPGRCVVQIHIEPQWPVSELHRFFPAESLSFISNGIQLSDTFTFDFYRLHDKDVIVALPRGAPSADLQRWCVATDDSEAFTDQVGFLVGTGTSREVARLRDYQMIRVEKRPRTFRRFASACRNAGQTRTSSAAPCSLTVVDRPEEPSADPLPILWRTEGGDAPVAAAPVSVVKDRPNLEIVSINDEV